MNKRMTRTFWSWSTLDAESGDPIPPSFKCPSNSRLSAFLADRNFSSSSVVQLGAVELPFLLDVADMTDGDMYCTIPCCAVPRCTVLCVALVAAGKAKGSRNESRGEQCRWSRDITTSSVEHVVLVLMTIISSPSRYPSFKLYTTYCASITSCSQAVHVCQAL